MCKHAIAMSHGVTWCTVHTKALFGNNLFKNCFAYFRNLCEDKKEKRKQVKKDGFHWYVYRSPSTEPTVC